MENILSQLSHLGILYNVESFKNTFDIDLLGKKNTSLMERFKYFNSEKRMRVYIPKMLYWILKKDPSFSFYISRTSVVETENRQTLYLNIEIDFYFEDYKKFDFTICEIKSFLNAKYLPFNKFENETFQGDYLFSDFGFLRVIAERTVIKQIESNAKMPFHIDFFENKNSILLKIN